MLAAFEVSDRRCASRGAGGDPQVPGLCVVLPLPVCATAEAGRHRVRAEQIKHVIIALCLSNFPSY